MLFERLKSAAIKKGCEWKDRSLEINIVGVRNTQDIQSNRFNDFVFVAWRDEPEKTNKIMVCEATTDPGLFYRKNPANSAGTAILPLGYYKSIWKIGKHQGKYEALVQVSPISVYRDNNKNDSLDTSQLSAPGMFGINLHRANELTPSAIVDKWSAGCQVIASPSQFQNLIAVAKRSAKLYSNDFDYTLLTDSEIN